MKMYTAAFFTVMVSAVFVSPAWADGTKYKEERIATMREAADALKESNSGLSKKLKDFADQDAEWMKKQENPELKRD